MKMFIYTALLGTAFLTGTTYSTMAQENALSTFEDGSNITFQGKVSDLSDDEFKLQFRDQSVNVDFAEWDWTNDINLKNHLVNGQDVYVSGTVDKNWFSDNEIEANNIYFQDNMSYYYVYDTSPAYYVSFDNSPTMRDGSYVSMRGTVQSIDGQEFTLSSQGDELDVNMSGLSYKPKGDVLNLEKGDRVFVFGEIDTEFFNAKELLADAVVKLYRVNQEES